MLLAPLLAAIVIETAAETPGSYKEFTELTIMIPKNVPGRLSVKMSSIHQWLPGINTDCTHNATVFNLSKEGRSSTSFYMGEP